MKNKDLRIGIMLLIIFLVLFGISFTFQDTAMSETHYSAAFFPRVILIIATGMALILIVKNIFTKNASADTKRLTKEQKTRVLGSMALAVVFTVSVVVIGTFVSIFLLIIAIMVMWGVRNKAAILLNAILTPLFIYYLFTRILLVQFPSGLLF